MADHSGAFDHGIRCGGQPGQSVDHGIRHRRSYFGQGRKRPVPAAFSGPSHQPAAGGDGEAADVHYGEGLQRDPADDQAGVVYAYSEAGFRFF